MGFFSDLFFAPCHRTIALKAYQYCISEILTEKEVELVRRYNIDSQKYIVLRNIGNFSMFIGIYELLSSKYPKTKYGISYMNFQLLYRESKYSSKIKGWAMWDTELETFCKDITGGDFSSLTTTEQIDLRKLVEYYQNEILLFFKKYSKNLGEAI